MSETTAASTACLLIYDIPDASPVANPSGVLRRFAVRVNLSCWVIREAHVNHPTVLQLLNRMREGGATWHTVKFEVGETEKLVDMAVTAIRNDVRAAVARARAGIDTQETRFGSEELPLAEREKAYKATARAIVRRAQRLIDSVRQGCERFGIVPDVYRGFLDAMSGNVSEFDARVKARCETFTTAVRNARRAVKSGTRSERKAGEIRAATQALVSEAMPADIFADFMEENEIDGAAELRDAFSASASI